MPSIDLKKALPFVEKRLDNGLRIVMSNVSEVPIVCLHLTYKVGSKNEKPNKTGFAHLFEHLMFEGSKNVPQGDFDRICSEAGGSNNAYTSFDQTVYYMTLPKSRLELGLWLESDRALGFAATEEALKTQQNVVSEEIYQTVENRPYGAWRELLYANSYSPDCPYAWPVQGRREHVVAYGIEDAREFYEKFYRPDNALLTLVGSVDYEKDFALVEKYFGEISAKNGGIRRPKFDDSMKIGGRHVKFEDDIPLRAVFIAYHIPGFTEDEFAAIELAGAIASDGKSSRLHKSLVYDKQIASAAGLMIEDKELSSQAIFFAIASVPEVTCDELAEELLKEIDKFVESDVRQEEIDKANNRLLTGLGDELQYSYGSAEILSRFAIFEGDPGLAYDLIDKYKRITPANIRDVAKKYFRFERSVRVDAEPKPEAAV